MLPVLSYSLCASAIGGLEQIFIIPIIQVLSVPDALDYFIDTEIVLAEGASLTELQFPDGAADYSEISAENDHGTFYKQKLSLFIPKDTPNLADWVNTLGQIKYCLAVHADNNGNWKIIGSPEFPLAFSSELETGKTAGSKYGHTFTWSGEAINKAYFYNFDSTTLPEPDNSGQPVSIVDGNGRVIATVQPGGIFQIRSGFSYGFRILN